ncbi:uracil-DNA glycosylase [Paenibacillus sp. GD4]|nr:uracil-DNA glycosylase [Paenibacillus sp. GD4]
MNVKPNAANGKNVRINCFQCKNFYVTWDPSFPRGCRSYGIKTRELPSAVVLRTTGQPCIGFADKH